MTNKEKQIEIWKLVYELEVIERGMKWMYEEDRSGTLNKETVSHIHELRDTLITIGECTTPAAQWSEETAWIEDVLPEISLNLESYSESLTEEEYQNRLEDDQSTAEFWGEQWNDVSKRVVRLMQAE